jgi:ribulose 1,5-bisphosphate synthetase/thiazole synthase
MIHKFDVVIVGAGGAGLRAAVEIPKEINITWHISQLKKIISERELKNTNLTKCLRNLQRKNLLII